MNRTIHSLAAGASLESTNIQTIWEGVHFFIKSLFSRYTTRLCSRGARTQGSTFHSMDNCFLETRSYFAFVRRWSRATVVESEGNAGPFGDSEECGSKTLLGKSNKNATPCDDENPLYFPSALPLCQITPPHDINKPIPIQVTIYTLHHTRQKQSYPGSSMRSGISLLGCMHVRAPRHSATMFRTPSSSLVQCLNRCGRT